MEKEDDVLDGDIGEEGVHSFNDGMYDVLSPSIKKFLIDYYGMQFYNLEAETYRELEAIIREQLEMNDQIPDILYIHRTITDSDLWDEALHKFERTNVFFPWPHTPQWYDNVDARIENGGDNETDEFMEETYDPDIIAGQMKFNEIMNGFDEFWDSSLAFAAFMKKGCGIFIKAMQSYIEDTASFDLTILSPEGFNELQANIERTADRIFDKIYGLMIEMKIQ
jgi:hypothetical protein